LLKRFAFVLTAAATVVTMLGAPAANATPTTIKAASVTTRTTGNDDGGRARDRDRRPTATPLVTLEQDCQRRICRLRVLVDDGRDSWICRPTGRPTTRDRDRDELQGRVARINGGDDGRDDNPSINPLSLRLRLRCVLDD